MSNRLPGVQKTLANLCPPSQLFFSNQLRLIIGIVQPQCQSRISNAHVAWGGVFMEMFQGRV
jgi:hypothetical protein